VGGVRALCVELLADVPVVAREIMLLRLATVQRASDVLHLRSALFDVVSRFHGEVVARERTTTLDRQFQ
jgi:hypothetical protein